MSRFQSMATKAAAFLLPLLCVTSQAGAAYVPPQVSALDSLRAISAVPVEVRYRNGFPSGVRVDLPAVGSTEVEQARNFLTTYAAFYLQDHPDVELVHVRSDDEPVDGGTVRFAQRAYGFPVFGAEIVVGIGKDEAGLPRILSTTGWLFAPSRMDRIGAADVAFDKIPAILPETAEDAARADAGFPAAPVMGETLLMIYDPGMESESPDPRLVWRVTLRAGAQTQYLVDANSGEILLRFPLVPTGAGLADFDLDLEDANGGNMVDTNCFNPTTIDDQIGDEDGIDPAYLNDVDASAAWFHARSTYLTYHDTFGRHSYDDDDGQLTVYVHSSTDNAAGTGACGVEFRNGWVSKDVMGHEFTHMVTDYTSDLVYAYQPGALNESFSDIMGAMVDPYDWLVAEDRTNGLGAIRDLSDPTQYGCGNSTCPDHMSVYINTSSDNGGVHYNSQIVSHAFQLMSDGGSFGGVTVAPMGRTKAGHLAYRAFTTLGQLSQFITLRDNAIFWAAYFDLLNAHGFTSADVCTTRNGFAAVGLGFPDSDCDGIEDNVDDSDGDGVLDNGDFTGGNSNYPCPDGSTLFCDDNCRLVANPGQADFDGDGIGDACDSDSDQDGVPDWYDHCPGYPGSTGDTDGDTIYDCFDPDDDNDGILDDGDASGTIGDNPCPSGVTSNCDDNCQWDANASQFDGNQDGLGDACDPDVDGDGWYGGYSGEDNCPFTYNPTQADADTDGLGDACDKCPNVSDNANAWHPGYPELGVDPFPIQQDSDNDGIPDACDGSGWGAAGASADGAFYHVGNALRPSGMQRQMNVTGPAGSMLRLPFMACDNGTPEGPGTNERVEAIFEDLPAGVSGWVENGSGEVRAWIRPHESDPSMRGFRFRPRCDRDYFLVLRIDSTLPASSAFQVTVASHTVPEANPWSSNAALFMDPPPDPPDSDGDDLPDSIDTCPTVADPSNADADHDGIGDACDADPGGPVTLIFTGVVTVVGGGHPPDPIVPGDPFVGRITYDTTMDISMDDAPVSRSYYQPSPISPLQLSVTIDGLDFSAGPGDGLSIMVENDNALGEDRFVVASGDVAEYSAATEGLTLTLRDPSGAALWDTALPPGIKPAEFLERKLQIDLDTGSSSTSAFLTLEIHTMSAPYRAPGIYWLDGSTSEIRRSDLDGSNIVTLVNAANPVGFEVDLDGDSIYWTECCTGKVRRSALDGTGAVSLTTGIGFPYGIGLDAPTGTLIFAQISSPLSLLSVGVGGGTAAPFISSSPNTPYGVAVDESAGKVYWTEFGTIPLIRRANVDGTGAETVIDGSVSALANSQGIALDVPAGKMYWTDLGYDRIYRANLDGSGQQKLVDFVSAGLQNPIGIAVDPLHGKLYWTDTTLHAIQRSNLDGSMVENVLTVADGLSYPRDLFVDPGTACQPPTAAVSIDGVEVLGGTDPTLSMTDTNSSTQVSGYNVYRSPDPGQPRSSWPLVALDAPDGDGSTPGVQWTDTSGNPPPGGIWYYTSVAYNAACPLEGPQ